MDEATLLEALYKSIVDILIPIIVGGLGVWLGKLFSAGDKIIDDLVIKHVTREQLVSRTFNTPAEKKRENVIEAVKLEIPKSTIAPSLPSVLNKSIWPEADTNKIAKVLEQRVDLIKGAMREAETQIKIKSDAPPAIEKPALENDIGTADTLIGEFILPKAEATLDDSELDE